MNSQIFVQIASYRDPELKPTIRDCIEKADNPENLTFGICWQHGDDEDMTEFSSDRRFRIIDVPWWESDGLGWARSKTQSLYNNESFTMQLDSHHRFVPGWDTKLKNMMEATSVNKPIITTYANSYNPKTTLDTRDAYENLAPYKIIGKKFTEGGTILLFPEIIREYQQYESPIPGRFVSGHFFFTLGNHCKEYDYDPLLYFAGDELSLSVRSFTMGYDIFSPHRTVVFHEYTREGRSKHWGDFVPENKSLIKKVWHEYDTESKLRLRQMLGINMDRINTGVHIGKERTIHDYELYAGVNFRKRRLHKNLTDGVTPPTLTEAEFNEWKNIQMVKNEVEIIFPKMIKPFNFYYTGISEVHGIELWRHDYNSSIERDTITFESRHDERLGRVVFWRFDGNWREKEFKTLSLSSSDSTTRKYRTAENGRRNK